MKKSIVALGLMLALTAGAASLCAARPQESTAANCVDQYTGYIWQKTTEQEKTAFLFGVETAITVEYFVNGKLAEKSAKAGKRPNSTLSPFEKGWMKAFKGMSRSEVITQIDAWYAANPQKLDRSVMAVIWYELIVPRLSAK